MDQNQKLQLLEEATREFAGNDLKHKISQLYGVSNSAKIIGGGLQIGGSNLEKISQEIESCIFYCVMRFFPDEEVYFAIHIREGLKELYALLDELTNRVGEKPLSTFEYAGRNNNVAIALANRTGKLYLRNKGHWDNIDQEIAGLDKLTGDGVTLDEISVAFYPPKPGVTRSQLAREFVGYLGAFVGKEKVSELHPWPEEGGASSSMTRAPLSVDLAEIKTVIKNQGGHYVANLIERYHVGLNHNPDKHFVILSGISGTGKSKLAIQYSRAIHGVTTDLEPDPFFYMCPVRPEWTDPTGVIGYHDLLTDRYIVPPFLEAIIVALANPDTPVFACLDEMNLAKVEFYLSDILSAMESGFPIHLHSSTLPIEGSIGGEIQASMDFPKNFYITGTINIDETSSPISDKVLDRAVVIDMSSVDVSGYLDSVEKDPKYTSSVGSLRTFIQELSAILSENSQGFGYRMMKESVQYYSVAVETLGRPSSETIDELLVQKLLVKLHGDENNRSMLEKLSKLLGQYPETAKLLKRLEDDLNIFESFQNSR